MQKWKLIALGCIAVLGTSAVLFISQTKAQSSVPFQCGQIRDLVSSNQPWGSGGVYVSANGTRIGKILDGRLQHDSYTSVNGVGKSVTPGMIKIGSGNATGAEWDFWIVCGDGQMVQVFMPSISGGYGLCVASDGSTYYIPPTAPYNSEQGSCSSSVFTGANLKRSPGAGATPQPAALDLTAPYISSINVLNVTQTGAMVTWTTDENSDSQVEYGLTTSFGSTTVLDSTMTTSHSVNLTNLTAGTTYNFKVKSKDAAGNLSQTSSTFTTLAVSYSFELTKTSQGIVEAKPGTSASIRFKLRNTSTVNIDFPVYCDSGYGGFMGNMYYLNSDGTLGEKFYNPGAFSGTTSNPSGNVIIAPGTEKDFEFKFDIPTGVMSVGGWTAKCHTYPKDNSTGNSLTDKKQEITDAFSVPMPVASDTPAIAIANPLTQYGTNKYSLKVNDSDGIKEFSIKKAGGSMVYGGSPGVLGNTHACGGSSVATSVESGTVTIENADFPLSATVTDCRPGTAAYTFSVPRPGTVQPPTPTAPSIGSLSPNSGKVYSSVTISGSGFTATGNKIKFGNLGVEDSPKYQLDSSDGKTLTFNVPQGNYMSCWGATPACLAPAYNTQPGSYEVSVINANGTSNVATFTVTDSTTPPSPTSCKNGEKCVKGSWCDSGNKCFYPDSQVTCVQWPNGPIEKEICPAGTSSCDPSDSNCTTIGQVVPYTSGRTCSLGRPYYSLDGKQFMCASNSGSAPSGFSTCRPDDENCIASGKYGPSSGWCSDGMKCHQKISDKDSRNDIYCAPTPTYTSGSGMMEAVSCPSGYSVCSPTDTNCKSQGDKWEASDPNANGFYCMSAQKCSLPGGGGLCVKWSEACPVGALYCSNNTSGPYETSMGKCIEPDTTETLNPDWNFNYWCGASGEEFYSSTKVYCPPKKTGGMMTGEEVKEILAKLGSGWGLCRPSDKRCIEPGKTGPSDGWCAWYPAPTPSMSSNMMPNSSSNTSLLACPDFNGKTPILPELCGMAVTRAFNPKTSECRDFSTTCLPDGWFKRDCKITDKPEPPPPPKPRECAPGEMPTSNNYCVMPMYRWSYTEKKFEKCADFSKPTESGYTSCTSMNYDLEVGWRTKRYLAHPPEKEGEWYMPPWDAAYDKLRYNPEKDAFEECTVKDESRMYSPMDPIKWTGPCQPVPPTDKEWMMEMYKSQYKMFLAYSEQSPPTPGPEPFPEPVTVPVPQPNPVQCKPYLASIKQGLVGDKQFWRDVSRKINEVKGMYADEKAVRDLLAQSKILIVTIEKATKGTACTKEALAKIQENLDKLHTKIFSELSAHLTDMEDAGRLGRCKIRLVRLKNEIEIFLKQTENDEDKETLESLAASIKEQAGEFGRIGDEDYEFDLAFNCESLAEEVDKQLVEFRMSLNEDTRRIGNEVEKALGEHLETLKQGLYQQQNKIDELIVQVAELRKAAEDLTQTAKEVSDKLITSYTALAQMASRFEEDRRQILESKDKLVTLVEEAMNVMKDTGCVRSADKELMTGKLGEVATVNWTPDRGAQLEKRLQLIVESCRAKDFTREDMNSFFANLEEAKGANMSESFRRGYTPFADVPTHEWYYGGMVSAHENGYMTKGMPAENVLAQDALLMILRATGASSADINGDCELKVPEVKNVSPYAVCAVNYASQKGIPLLGNMTLQVERIQIAQWITLLKSDLPKPAENVDLSSFADIQLLGNDRQFVASMYSNGVMVGRTAEDGTTRYFDPEKPLTRAALAVILNQLAAK